MNVNDNLHCDVHNRDFKNLQGYKQHMTKTHKYASEVGPPETFVCEHEQCVPKMRYRSEGGLQRHNKYVIASEKLVQSTQAQQELEPVEKSIDKQIDRTAGQYPDLDSTGKAAKFVLADGKSVPTYMPKVVGELNNIGPGEYGVVVLLISEYRELKGKAEAFDKIMLALGSIQG